MAFRGGTALNKLFLFPPSRYSEDIDLVRTSQGPIAEIVDNLRLKLDPWLGEPKYYRSNARFVLYYRFLSTIEPISKLRLKIEINTRSPSPVLDLETKKYVLNTNWFKGNGLITTYQLEELIATKLCALYERKKGRDLFDLGTIITSYPKINHSLILSTALKYFEANKVNITRAKFEENLLNKLNDLSFTSDIKPLLPINLLFNLERTIQLVTKHYIGNLPGAPWKGKNK